jgi:hypothetical protein
MYLAKFFHRPPGDDDRELMLIPGSNPMVMGIHMNREGEPGSDQYLREEFPDTPTPPRPFGAMSPSSSQPAISRRITPNTRCAISGPIRKPSRTGRRGWTS